MQSYKRHNLVQPVGRYSRSLQSMLTRKHPAPSAHSMRMLQHRGKAYWSITVGNSTASGEGSLLSEPQMLKIAEKEKLIWFSWVRIFV